MYGRVRADEFEYESGVDLRLLPLHEVASLTDPYYARRPECCGEVLDLVRRGDQVGFTGNQAGRHGEPGQQRPPVFCSLRADIQSLSRPGVRLRKRGRLKACPVEQARAGAVVEVPGLAKLFDAAHELRAQRVSEEIRPRGEVAAGLRLLRTAIAIVNGGQYRHSEPVSALGIP